MGIVCGKKQTLCGIVSGKSSNIVVIPEYTKVVGFGVPTFIWKFVLQNKDIIGFSPL